MEEEHPPRPIVSSRGSVTYGVAKELVKILKPLTGNTIHHVSNSKEFAEEIKKNKLDKGECIISYYVSAPFTSVTVKSAMKIIKDILEQDKELNKRTSMSINNILELLEFCLCNTYFLFQGQFYEQTKGAAMGSPVSPVVANLFIEYFEHRALTSAVNPPRLWKRYVDDTFVILQQSQKEGFLQHINSVDASIKFTTEEPKDDGSMPFQDTLVTPKEDGTLTTCVYRKPTHTDLYLQCDSHHNLACKFSVINTLTHRARAVCSNSELLKTELKHIDEVLSHCKYPKWAIDRMLHLQQKGKENRNRRKKGNNISQTNRRCHIVVPSSQCLYENYKNICSKCGVQVHFKGGNTLKNLLMFPKDREAKTKQSNQSSTNFLCNRIDFSRSTSFCQSNCHGFIWCKGKYYPYHNTHFGWCMWNVIIYNFEFCFLAK